MKKTNLNEICKSYKSLDQVLKRNPALKSKSLTTKLDPAFLKDYIIPERKKPQ